MNKRPTISELQAILDSEEKMNVLVKPDGSVVAHPEHNTLVGPSYTQPAKPLRASWGLLRWRLERACRKRGGHWWHPEGMIGWFCCQCGSERDGMPKDGE